MSVSKFPSKVGLSLPGGGRRQPGSVILGLYKPQVCIASPNRERVTPHHPPTAETRECTFVIQNSVPAQAEPGHYFGTRALAGRTTLWRRVLVPRSVRPPAVRPRAQSSLLWVFALRMYIRFTNWHSPYEFVFALRIEESFALRIEPRIIALPLWLKSA